MSTQFALDLACGLVTVDGVRVVHKFGFNPDVDLAGIEDIWTGGGVLPWLQVADTIDVVSDEADDNLIGSGARRVCLIGLDEDWNQVIEIVNMAGLIPITTLNKFIRINRIFVTASGTYGATGTWSHAGTITCIPTGGATTKIAEIFHDGNIGYGQTQQANFSVPEGFTAAITYLKVNVDANKVATAYIFQRQNADFISGDVGPIRLIARQDGVIGPDDLAPRSVLAIIPSRSDFWVSATVTGNNTAINVDMEIFIFRNDLVNNAMIQDLLPLTGEQQATLNFFI